MSLRLFKDIKNVDACYCREECETGMESIDGKKEGPGTLK